MIIFIYIDYNYMNLDLILQRIQQILKLNKQTYINRRVLIDIGSYLCVTVDCTHSSSSLYTGYIIYN